MEQHGTYPSWKGTNEHEGLAKSDVDGDGIQDIIGAGLWFKYLGNDKFSYNIMTVPIPSADRLPAAIPGGRPEIVLVVGDGLAPMYMYDIKRTPG
jgi:hypothetical protein